MHVGYDVVPVDLDVLADRRAQRDVQDRAVLGHVDALATEHRLEALAQPACLCQREQQLHRLVGDAVLGVVEVDPVVLDRQPGAPLVVRGEQLAQVRVPDGVTMRDESGPLRCGRDIHAVSQPDIGDVPRSG